MCANVWHSKQSSPDVVVQTANKLKMSKTRIKPVQGSLCAQPTKKHFPSIQLNPFLFWLMRFQQFVGLCPVYLSSDGQKAVNIRTNQRLLVIWICLIFVVFFLLHFGIIWNHATLLYNEDGFGKVSDVCKLSITVFAHIITFCEVLLQRRKMAHFLQIYCRIQRSCTNTTVPGEAIFFRQFLLLSGSYMFLMLSVEFSYSYERIFTQAFYFHLSFMPSVILCRLRLNQIMFLMEMLRRAIEHLNCEIHKLAQSSGEYRKNGGIAKLKALELGTHQMMLRYADIFEMSQLLKNSTKFSLTSIYVMTYIKMLTDCYWAVWLVNKGNRVTEFILLIPTSLNIFQLLYTSRNCMNSTCFLAHNIHKLRHSVEDLHLSARIQNISLQLRHQQIINDAFGLLIMNCYIVKGILASIATYMLVFKQILPKFTTY